METSKPFWKSKTIWLAVIQAVLGIIAAFALQYPAIGILATIKSVLDIVLRSITELPIN